MDDHHEVVEWGGQKYVADEYDCAEQGDYEYFLQPLRPMYPLYGMESAFALKNLDFLCETKISVQVYQGFEGSHYEV